MVWLFLISASALLCVGSIWAKEWRIPTAIILLSYLAMQVAKVVFVGDAWSYSASAAIWLISSGAIQRQVVRYSARMQGKLVTITGLLAGSGTCYFWAYLTEAPREFGSLPFVVSDLTVIVAMLIMGWSIGGQVITRYRDSTRLNAFRYRNLDSARAGSSAIHHSGNRRVCHQVAGQTKEINIGQ